MSNEVEQIKERLGVAEIIGEYIKLEKSGVNYKALCPFHNEKTPSFTVNTERNFWYCFGCQEGGDIFSFVQKIEGLDFREALEKLAERANVELPKFNSQSFQESKNVKQKALSILELVTKIYQQQLLKSKKSKEVLVYLKKRGFTKEVVKNFRLGYAPEEWRVVTDYLSKKGFDIKDALNAGVIIHKDGTNGNDWVNYYDRFRDRIMFPIIDVNGKVVGYSARIMPGGDEKTGKYINSPQSLIYDKSKVLYGLHQARQAIRKSGYAIVVEGNADVVLSHSIGVKNIVAVSGTALTESQVKLLKRYTDKVMLSFDMDSAGQKATKKSIQVCLQNDLQVKIILLPDGFKDVGEVVERDKGKWMKVIREARPVMEYYFETLFAEYDVDDIQDKKIIVKELLSIIGSIADLVEQSYWLKKLALRTQTDDSLLTSLLEKVKLSSRSSISQSIASNDDRKQGGQRGQSVKNKKVSRIVGLKQRLLGLMAHFRNEIDEQLNDFVASDFFSGDELEIFELLKEKKSLGRYDNFVNKCVTELLYEGPEYLSKESDINPVKEWKKVVEELGYLQRRELMQKIELELKQAEASGDEDRVEELMGELNKLLMRKKSV